MTTTDLMYYYQTVIRPVTEYACVVWHSSLTKGQANQLESIQRRAMKLIFNNNDDDITNALNSLPSLSERREQITKLFFNSLLDPKSCLHHLIPEKRDADLIARLRITKQYLPHVARTERFKKSSVTYAVENYLL